MKHISPFLRAGIIPALFFGLAQTLCASAVTSIARLNPGPVVTGTSTVFQVTFNQSVTGVAAGAFSITTTGTASGAISSVSSVSGSVYDVTVNSLSGIGSLRVDLSNGSAISGSPAAFTRGQSYVVSSSSTPVAWGDNTYSELGNNSETNSPVPVTVTTSGALAGKTVAAVSTGAMHSLAVTSDGTVYAWGDNGNGKLGNPSVPYSAVPIAVSTSGVLSGKTIVAVAAGSYHSLALASDGTVYSWGYNGQGELGNNSYSDSGVPVAVNTSGVLAGKTIVAIAAGYYQSLALASDGTVYGWGENSYGELGNNATTGTNVPVAVTTSGVLAGKTIIAIASGGYTSMALASDGTAYTWGNNNFGQLGNNSTVNRSVPVAVDSSGVLAGKTIVAISVAGYTGGLVLASDGTVYDWGYNNNGQLGNNSTAESNVPVAVSTGGALVGKTVVAIAAGDGHNLALSSDGTVCAWGFNSSGQLGNNSTVDSSVPVAVNTSSSSALYGMSVIALGTVSDGIASQMLAAPAPLSVVSVSPNSGGIAGGTSVTITGIRFTGATAVNFGSISAASFTVNSETSITATSPAGSAGTVDVTVTTASGTSAANAGDQFTYNAGSPVISSLLTASGTYGSAISMYTITASNSPGSYGAAGLPPGLTVNTGNGQITGTPTSAAGSPYSVTLSATNGNGAGTAILVFTIAKATATVSLTSLNATYDGTAKSAGATTTPGGLTVNFTYNGSGTSPTAAGSYSVIGTVNNTNYQGAATGTLSIAKATPAITWPAPAPISPTTALSGTQLNATANTPGTFVYNPASGSVLGSGSHTLNVTFTPTDAADYNTATASTTLTGSLVATVTLGNLSQTYDGTAKIATATTVPAGLSLIITYGGSSGPPVNAGTYAVTAMVNDPAYIGAAGSALVISQASQTISFAPITAAVGAPVTLSATASSGLSVSFSLVSGNASLSGSTLTIKDTNPVTVQASQAGNANYKAAPAVTQTASASGTKLTQTIAFSQPADQPTNAGPLTLAATATSGLPVTCTVLSGPATISGNVLTLTGAAGTVVIQASQAGNGTYLAATSTTISFNVYVPSELTFFGQTGGTSGSSDPTGMRPDASGINLAACVAADRSGGMLIGYLSAQAEGFAVSFTTNSQGKFTASTTALTGGSTSGPTLTFSGQVTASAITGTIVELSLPFTASLDPSGGPTAAISSLYQASTVASSSGTTYSIVGTQGEVYVLAVTPGLVTGGTGTVGSNNSFSVSTAQSVTISGSINPGTTAFTGSITLSNGGTVACSGLCTTTPSTDKVVNLSSRGFVGTGSNSLVSGFIIAGQSPKQVLLRAIGPTLSTFGVSGVLSNPVLQLYDSSGNLLLTNSGWGGDSGLVAVFSQVGAFALPAGSADAAAVATLQPGAYTVQVSGAAGSTGIALVEVYDVSASSQACGQRLVNVSSRGEVTNGVGVLVTGFVVSGNSPKKVLIRGAGPTLQSSFNFPGTLSDPILSVFSSTGAVIAQNDNWGTPTPVTSTQAVASASDLVSAFTAVGAFPLGSGSKDAALITTLAPGAYTVQISGVGGATGVAIIEVYEMP